MDSGGFWWILVDSDGFWWILMDSDGFWWILVDSDGYVLGSGRYVRVVFFPVRSGF